MISWATAAAAADAEPTAEATAAADENKDVVE